MKILIVDDEPLVRRSLARVLRSRGHEVSEAADGNAGLELWKTQPVDLVFLDVLMPGLTGPQVLAALGSAKKGKVVLMSAYAGDHNVEKAPTEGVDLFIPKPFEDIFEVVRLAEDLIR